MSIWSVSKLSNVGLAATRACRERALRSAIDRIGTPARSLWIERGVDAAWRDARSAEASVEPRRTRHHFPCFASLLTEGLSAQGSSEPQRGACGGHASSCSESFVTYARIPTVPWTRPTRGSGATVKGPFLRPLFKTIHPGGARRNQFDGVRTIFRSAAVMSSGPGRGEAALESNPSYQTNLENRSNLDSPALFVFDVLGAPQPPALIVFDQDTPISFAGIPPFAGAPSAYTRAVLGPPTAADLPVKR